MSAVTVAVRAAVVRAIRIYGSGRGPQGTAMGNVSFFIYIYSSSVSVAVPHDINDIAGVCVCVGER